MSSIDAETDWLRLLCDLQRLDDPRVAAAAPRFMSNLRVANWPEDEDWPCIETTYAVNEHGYARFHVPSLGIHLAHKFGCLLFSGNDPRGRHVHHRCENKRCVVHLEVKEAGAHIR